MNVLRPTWRFDFIEGKSLRCTKFRIVSSPQLARVLDPTQDGVSLETLNRAAAALGRKVRLELV